MTASGREIMTRDAECAHTDDTVSDAARRMKDLVVGALPICGEDNRLAVGDYAGDEVVTIGVDDSIDEAQATMTKAGLRRLPVTDGHDLVGMVSQTDIARNLPADKVGNLVQAISSLRDNC
jgi:CBS domain-containing protein